MKYQNIDETNITTLSDNWDEFYICEEIESNDIRFQPFNNGSKVSFISMKDE